MNSNETTTTTEPVDERHGVPSASYMHRISNCPASFKLGRLFRDPRTRDSDSGDVTHKAIELWPDPVPGLDHHQLQTVEMCVDWRNELLDNWIGEGDYTSHRERRIGLTILGKCIDVEDGKKLRLVFSGKADYTAISADGKNGLVIDYKTLHGDHPAADVNDQLRSLAVLLFLRHNLESVRVAIVQPWKGRPTVADYDLESLKAAHAWVIESLKAERESQPEQTKVGDWCQHCPARVKCLQKPVLDIVSAATQGIEHLDPETVKKAIWARAAELPDSELAERYKGLPMIGWYLNAIEGNARARAIEGGSFADYYTTKETKPKEQIDDVKKVWGRLAALGTSADDFTAQCKTSKKGVALLARKATGLKGKALDIEIAKVLEGAVKLGKPTIKLVAAGAAIEDGDDDNEEEVEE